MGDTKSDLDGVTTVTFANQDDRDFALRCLAESRAAGTVIELQPAYDSRAQAPWYRLRRLFGWRDPMEKFIRWAFAWSPNGDVTIINCQTGGEVDVPAAEIEWVIASLKSPPDMSSVHETVALDPTS